MTEREPRVYLVPEKKGKKALLIFDRGYAGGGVHVYEFKESISTEDMQKEIDLPAFQKQELVSHWIEKKHGFPMYWTITSQK